MSVRGVAARLGRGARRLHPLTLVTIALVGIVGTVMLTRDHDPPANPGGTAVRVGVSDGDDVPGYVAASQRELAGLSGDSAVYALVSLTAYRKPADVPAEILVAAYARVPVPNRQTEIVRLPAGDLAAAMREVAARKRAAAARYSAEGGPAGSAAVAIAEADGYQAECACVFALLVHGPPTALRRLAESAGVRAVDPAPEVTRLDRAVFVAPLPEQTDIVRPPADEDLPAPG